MENIRRYKEDIEKLCKRGEELMYGLYAELMDREPNLFEGVNEEVKNRIKGKSFKNKYNSWYNESLALIKQLAPERLSDFKSYYKIEKRKVLSYETYTVSDYLVGLVRQNTFGEVVVKTSSVLSKFEQQQLIVVSLKDRFDSSLYDIKQLLQADLCDSEIASARELCKAGFYRAAGAVAGVVLEKHLGMVCDNHNIVSKKKAPSINDFNQSLKENDVIDMPTWRHIQFLGDIRNLCDHGKAAEPQKEQALDLIDGTEKIIKTVF